MATVNSASIGVKADFAWLRDLALAAGRAQTGAMVLLLYGYPKKSGWWPPPARR